MCDVCDVEHWSLRLSGGKGSCSGRLEVYHNATWGSVCDDQWNISNAQVVCRQLGCGSVLSADRFGPGEGTVWLNRVKCRGDEIHLWDCHHSLKKHTDCSHAGVTCADVSASTTSTTKSTTISTTTARRTSPRTSPVAPSTPPLVLFVLGTLLFLALVLLVVLFYQNRVLRRVVSKRRRKTQPEAVYEEINHRYITRRITSSTQRGSLLSEEQYSGYEHVDDELLSVKSGIGEKAEDYDDVIDTSDFISATGRVEAPEDYDDAVTAGPIPDNVDEDEAENYDDAITADQKSVLLTEDVCENYDDAVTAETNPNIITEDEDEDDDDDVISEEQDVGETGKCDEVEEKSQKNRDHVTETRHQRPFLRKLHFNFYKDKK
ncbi:antigen WC1.1-like [Silurus meridionalis]|uniref:antigen WC1.1-like n=1 Tax=Silurus meridionalis TaxID=175797 RepID=UPI001EECAE44|nr:antigen WC1.1-like [Silurus meridionalis]